MVKIKHVSIEYNILVFKIIRYKTLNVHPFTNTSTKVATLPFYWNSRKWTSARKVGPHRASKEVR